MKKEPNLKTLIIEGIDNNWSVVNCTELTDDGVWHCGLNLVTSLESVVERADKERVPIITRLTLDKLKEETKNKARFQEANLQEADPRRARFPGTNVWNKVTIARL